MKSIVTLCNASGELVIKHSKFIAYSFAICNEDDAIEKLNTLRKKHFDATHVCYAYIADEKGMVYKCSDDGEPSQSAGQPIMAVLKNGGYVKSLIAVVRYFGGTKLGVGGLVKAYTDSAALVESLCEKKTLTYCKIYSAKLDYNQYKRVASLINSQAKIINIDYRDIVDFTFAIYDDSLLEKINGLLSGKFEYNYVEEKYIEL